MFQAVGGNSDFRSLLARDAAAVDAAVRAVLAGRADVPARLLEAMSYVLEAPGKRIRSVLVLWCCELVSGRVNAAAMAAATAVEMVHTYSLVHDDLPAMDNDDMRRGRATCHKAFDEATAILTGDALLTLAFEVLASEVEGPAAVRLIRTLATAAGPAGMIAGQMQDMEAGGGRATMASLREMHVNKTAKMFAAAAAMGAIAGGASDDEIERLLQYGLKMGLAFQIADDLLDVSGTSEELGKTAGKDAAQGKVTYPLLAGSQESRRLARQLTDEAVSALEPFGSRAQRLHQLAAELLERTK